MKAVLTTVGALIIFFGAVWFLQGVNVLPGSFMTGQTRWAVIGGIALAAGIAMMVIARRIRRPSDP